MVWAPTKSSLRCLNGGVGSSPSSMKSTHVAMCLSIGPLLHVTMPHRGCKSNAASCKGSQISCRLMQLHVVHPTASGASSNAPWTTTELSARHESDYRIISPQFCSSVIFQFCNFAILTARLRHCNFNQTDFDIETAPVLTRHVSLRQNPGPNNPCCLITILAG